ncbi:hypothetical protein M758_UG019700 [Ceratodon purpureus]|nr:hypothetical protein M758_UG019700 [Ceratodon purpureus]
MASWEAVIRDGVLLTMLRQLRQSPSAWDYPGFNAPDDLPQYLCSIKDIDAARHVSPRWKELIENTAEWACIRLARFDYANEVGGKWGTFEEYELNGFLQNWELFGHSWRMSVPIPFVHLQHFPVARMTCGDLATLRGLLRDSNNVRIEVEHGQFISGGIDIWVSPLHRRNK